MADYKNIPVDEETYQKLVELCQAFERKQGAQVRAMVNHEYEKLAQLKLVGKKVAKKASVEAARQGA